MLFPGSRKAKKSCPRDVKKKPSRGGSGLSQRGGKGKLGTKNRTVGFGKKERRGKGGGGKKRGRPGPTGEGG